MVVLGRDGSGRQRDLELSEFRLSDESVAELLQLPRIGPGALDVSVPAPYLDQLTVGSPGMAPLGACEEHSRLLLEPIAVPGLEHTGLRTAFEKAELDLAHLHLGHKSPGLARDGGHGKGDVAQQHVERLRRWHEQQEQQRDEYPLFYPDGSKKKNFREDVRHAFRQVEPEPWLRPSAAAAANAAGAAPAGVGSGESDRALVAREAERALAKRRRSAGVREPSRSLSPSATVARPGPSALSCQSTAGGVTGAGAGAGEGEGEGNETGTGAGAGATVGAGAAAAASPGRAGTGAATGVTAAAGCAIDGSPSLRSKCAARRDPHLYKAPPREADKKLREILTRIRREQQRIETLSLY
jgi:hypothetical protein